MSKEPQIQQEEVKTKVAKRVPPGDRWTPLSNSTVMLDSLTDVLEFIYQDTGKHNFIWMQKKDLYMLLIQKKW